MVQKEPYCIVHEQLHLIKKPSIRTPSLRWTFLGSQDLHLPGGPDDFIGERNVRTYSGPVRHFLPVDLGVGVIEEEDNAPVLRGGGNKALDQRSGVIPHHRLDLDVLIALFLKNSESNVPLLHAGLVRQSGVSSYRVRLLKGGVDRQGCGGSAVGCEEQVEVMRACGDVVVLIEVKGLVRQSSSLGDRTVKEIQYTTCQRNLGYCLVRVCKKLVGLCICAFR